MSTTTPSAERSPDFQKLAELIADIRVAMLITFPFEPGFAGQNTRPHCRPMYTQKVDPQKFDGKLWFMTDLESGKVDELAENSEVLITYAAPNRNTYLAVKGEATVERDPEKAKELWNIHAKSWYPGGPTDPNLLLIEVQVISAEYWEGPSNTRYMLSLLKSLATGKRNEADGEHGKI